MGAIAQRGAPKCVISDRDKALAFLALYPISRRWLKEKGWLKPWLGRKGRWPRRDPARCVQAIELADQGYTMAEIDDVFSEHEGKPWGKIQERSTEQRLDCRQKPMAVSRWSARASYFVKDGQQIRPLIKGPVYDENGRQIDDGGPAYNAARRLFTLLVHEADYPREKSMPSPYPEPERPVAWEDDQHRHVVRARKVYSRPKYQRWYRRYVEET